MFKCLLLNFILFFQAVALLIVVSLSVVHSQNCVVTECTQRETGVNQNQYPLRDVQNVRPTNNPSSKPGINGRKKRDTRYKKPNKPIEHGSVIVMPPPGEAPQKFPQPGQRGGGARPEDNPYIAAMAPEGTVPIAIFPPFEKSPPYPTKCVIYSQLTDFEDEQINDYGNIPVYKVTLKKNINIKIK